MTLKDLIASNDWVNVEMTLMDLYPEQRREMEDFREMYRQLLETESEESPVEIVLEKFFEEDTDEEGYVEVSGIETGEQEETESLSLEFFPWKEWLGMTISERTLREYDPVEIICHCLVEMTFIGFDEEDIQRQFSLIAKDMEEYDMMSDDEKQAKARSLEDFLEDWDKEDDDQQQTNGKDLD